MQHCVCVLTSAYTAYATHAWAGKTISTHYLACSPPIFRVASLLGAVPSMQPEIQPAHSYIYGTVGIPVIIRLI